MPWSKETLEQIYPKPEGYILVHYRRPMGSDCYFGPFATVQEYKDWSREHKDVSAVVIPLYKTVDWRR